MNTQQNSAGYGFGLDLSGMEFGSAGSVKPSADNTQTPFLFGDDEGIDTTFGTFGQSFDSLNAQMYSLPAADASFAMPQNFALDNTLVNDSTWNSGFDFTSTTLEPSLSSYQPFNSNMKRPLEVNTQDFPQPKRHANAGYASNFTSPFMSSASLTTASWTVDTQPTPPTPSSSTAEVGLPDEAADVCATWFAKYAVLPNDGHINSLSQLTGEPAAAIRAWFGRILKQGLAGHDSAYKSQTNVGLSDLTLDNSTTGSQKKTAGAAANNETTTAPPAPPVRGGKKGCKPTNNPELLRRDENKIYQCTRKCGKRYGRKCDWKRNEEEGYPSKSWVCSLCVSQGVEKVKPCFRRYHFSQHFRNIHAGIDSSGYDEASVRHSETGFPRRCGFCPHRFSSRQDRIDHIADHFKKGKSMLDWNDDADENNDSDDVDGDDDDHNDDSGGNGGSSRKRPSSQGRPNGKSGDGAGKGNNGGNGGSGSSGGLSQYQYLGFQQGSSGQLCGVSQGFEQDAQQGNTEERERSADGQEDREGSQSCALPSPPDKQYVPGDYARDSETARDDGVSLAGDVVAWPLTHASSTSSIGDVLELVNALLQLHRPCRAADMRADKQEPEDICGSLVLHSLADRRPVLLNKGLPLPDELDQTPLQVFTNAARLTGLLYSDVDQLAKTEILERLRRLPLQSLLRSMHMSRAEWKTLIGIAPRRVLSLLNSAMPDNFKEVLLDGFDLDLRSMCLSPPSFTSVSSGTNGLMLTCSTLPNEHGASLEQLHTVVCQSGILEELENSDSSLDDGKLSSSETRDLIPRLRASSLAGGARSFTQLEDLYLKSQSFVSIKLLGTGGFSTVDEVLHKETNLRVSRKTLKNRQQSAVEELKTEVAVLQKLRHPHIIRFLGAYSKGDKVSILLSPVADTTLAVWLDGCHATRPAGLGETIITMFGCLTSSVRYLHEQRPVVKHMDIKPQNILVMQGRNGVPHVVLSDFGVSSADQTSPDQPPKPLTRRYCAPEVPIGAVRERAADVWSLGCVFLEMLMAAFGQDNPDWLTLRKEFSGRHGKYYWQEVPHLQGLLAGFLHGARTPTEATTLLTVKSMLTGDPDNRPTAAMVAAVFTPASCCLSWPNEMTSYPGPDEERAALDLAMQDICDIDAPTGKNRTQPECIPTSQDVLPFARAKTWLQECCNNHASCQRETDGTEGLPTRVIDIQPDDCHDGSWVQLVDTVTVAATAGRVQYAAISYCWAGQDSAFAMTGSRLQATQGKLSRDDIPANIKEAISTAQGMGVRYLWIDSLCILQDMEEEKSREIAAMASTYRNALLCMVLLSETDGGIAQALEPAASKWTTRLWTFQERLLSGRLLYLTGKQMYWECNSLKASETLPHGLPSLLWEKIHTKTEITTRYSRERIAPGGEGPNATSHDGLNDGVKQVPSDACGGCKLSRASLSPGEPTGSTFPLKPRSLSDCNTASGQNINNKEKQKLQKIMTPFSAGVSPTKVVRDPGVNGTATAVAGTFDGGEKGNGNGNGNRNEDPGVDMDVDMDVEMKMEMEMGG